MTATVEKVSHPLFARIYMRTASSAEDPHRRELLARLAGEVIEVGAGHGLNFGHYPETVDRVLAVEPEPRLRAAALAAAAEAPIEIEVAIYFEGAIFGQQNMRTLADRARHAAGRMIEGYPTTATRVVPREALSVVGKFSLREGRIMLIGPSVEQAVAEWLGALRLDPAELRRG
jgi:hypothetical protein